MIIKEYGMDDLAKARKLQKDMCDLHIPCPIMNWNYEIKEKDKIIEKGIGKSNSYTRNALNILASQLGFASDKIFLATPFGDGIMNVKKPTNLIVFATLARTSPENNVNNNPYVVLGINNTAETLESFATLTSGLTEKPKNLISLWDNVNRKLITQIIGSYTNSTGESIDITESGIISILCLYVRDVFAPITVGVGQTITWTYVTEVAYPNP